MTPSVGRVVHYVSHGTPVRADGSQEFTSQCRAAIVTEVYNAELPGEAGRRVNLAVLNPTGMFFNQAVPFDDSDHAGGSWHWPEREESGHP